MQNKEGGSAALTRDSGPAGLDKAIQVARRLGEAFLSRESRIFVLNRQNAVVANPAQRADKLAPPNAPVAGQHVAPPALALIANARQARRLDNDILGVHVEDPVAKLVHRGGHVDALPIQ